MELYGFARDIIETIREPLLVLEKDLKIIYATPNFYKTFQTKPESTIGTLIFDLGNQQWNIAALKKLLEDIIPKNSKFENYKVEHIFPGIGYKVMLLNARKIFHEEVATELILLSIEDITARITLENEVKESEELFRRLFETSKDGLLLIEKENKKIIKANPAILELFGYLKDDFIGYDLIEVGLFSDKALLKAAYQRVNKSGFIFFNNMQIQNKDREKIPIELYLIDRTKLIQCNVRNVSERKRIEAEILKKQKLESIGMLAGGIAHDFNNLLTVILGNINLAMKYINKENLAYQLLEEANRASTRAGDLTLQLLTFSSGGAPIKKPASIRKIIKDAARLALSGSSIQCEDHIEDNLWTVEVDEGQLNQVFLNLITNAKQALKDGEKVIIRAENTIIKKDRVTSFMPGEYIKISIEDTGVGISEEDIPKIFDPYFTTKLKGKGLGLAVVHSILTNHGGHITLMSTLGVGTTFFIYLPASKRKMIKKKIPSEIVYKGKGRVLIMDDEEMVRNILGGLLIDLGYEIGNASEGAEAIRMYTQAKKSKKPFDAVIMDLTIPGGMGGKDAIKKLKKIDPLVKAIVASGYSNDPIMADFKEYGFKAAISKPYNVLEVGKILQDVLK
jgi:PAS domain S-box-containing protein